MNYLPFDLETALAHPERVVTRDGRKASEIYHFKNKMISDYKVYACIENEIFTYTIEGLAIKGDTRERDLFLLPEVKECWVNVYEMGKTLVLGETHISKSEALENKSSAIALGHTYIKTIRITNEPE